MGLRCEFVAEGGLTVEGEAVCLREKLRPQGALHQRKWGVRDPG